MKHAHGKKILLAAALAVGAVIALPKGGQADASTVAAEPVSMGGPSTFRRLNEEQYKRTIAQVFGTTITVPGRFEPSVREEGLLAIGNSHVVVTPSGFEQFAIRARQISAQVMDDAHRKNVLSCEAGAAFDQACAQRFFDKYGRLLLRRPLSTGERVSVIQISSRVAKDQGSMAKGLSSGLYSLLVSPAFVFRIESTEPDPARPGFRRLDSYSLASRISFLLWDSPPDPELLDAAQSGALQTRVGLEQQVDRMLSSPRLEEGVRGFFSDMFGFDEFSGLTKDSALFPIFNPRLRDDAEEQTLKTVVDHLMTRQRDYRELFTTRDTFFSRSLAALYAVPMDGRNMAGWMPYTFAEDSRHAGLLTFPAFLMLDLSHEGRSSPTIRGKKVRENLLCQPVPNPPANVNFTIVQDTANPLYKTARERLQAHNESPACAGCHKITDPIGLSLENYTAVGQYRTTENGAKIDPSGEFEGKPYSNALELQKLLRDGTTASDCVVQRTFEYGVGRKLDSGEEEWLGYLIERFGTDGYRYPALLKRIATSPAFQAVSAEVPAQPTQKRKVALNGK